MWYRRLSVAVLALLALVVLPVYAQKDKDKKPAEAPKAGGKVTLKWKFEKGKTFYQKMTTDTTQTMKVLNNDVTQKQTQTFFFSWTPEKEEKDTWIIKQKIEGVIMNIDIGGSKISYDSTKEAQGNNPLGEFFKALVGAEFTLTLDMKTMKVTKVEGQQKFLDGLVKANPQMKPLLEKILSEQALKDMAEPTFAVVPDHPVAKGDTWTRKSTLDMGPIGKYENTYTYTYDGRDEKEGKLDKIKVKTVLKYSPPEAAAGGAGGLPFKIKEAKLESKEATGTIEFDSAKGRVAKSSMNLQLEGTLKIEIGGQQTDVTLSQTQKTDVETTDKNPVPEKKK